VKNFILAKSGWITRTIIPFFLKNYASHIAEEPEKLVRKIKHLFGKNGKVVRPE
jgi:urocanate hydratase